MHVCFPQPPTGTYAVMQPTLFDTTKTTESKLIELQKAEELRKAVAELVTVDKPNAPLADEPIRLREKLAVAQAGLEPGGTPLPV